MKKAERQLTHRFEAERLDTAVPSRQLSSFSVSPCLPGETFAPAVVSDDLRKITYPAWAEPKLNGVRLLATADARGRVTLRSRSGREYSLPPIAAAVRALCLRDTVLDGELVADEFETALSAIQGNATALAKCRYVMWDRIPRAAFEKGTGGTFSERRWWLERLPLIGYLEILKGGAIVHSEDAMYAFFRQIIHTGGEGIVVKNPRTSYHAGDWVRLKAVTTYDGVIVAAIEGKGRLAGSLGALTVEFDGIPTKVGTGFTDEERARLWRKRKSLVGRWLEATADRKTRAGKLSFPRFVRLREAKTA